MARSALFLPVFDALADPRLVAELAGEAEQAGWDGFFVWDHVRFNPPVVAVADPWISLAAVAVATERIRLGALVTPLARRRPVKVARETASLDVLSNGRLTFGAGLGSDEFGEEFTRTGEETDPKRRAAMLDEGLALLVAAWTGEPVELDGEYVQVRDVAFRPSPVQQPRIPVWIAATPGRPRPLRRAARYDGLVPVNLDDADQLAVMLEQVANERGGLDGFDVAVPVPLGQDPSTYIAAGATWWLAELPSDGLSADLVRRVIADGPLPE